MVLNGKMNSLSVFVGILVINIEKFAINLSNATFTNVEGFTHDNPDLAITINRSGLEQVMMGAKSFAASIKDGTAKAEGDAGILAQIAETLVTFQIGFEVLPGTSPEAKIIGVRNNWGHRNIWGQWKNE